MTQRERSNHHVDYIRVYVVEHKPNVLSAASSILEIESKSRREKDSFLEFIRMSENLSWFICRTKMKMSCELRLLSLSLL